MKLQRSVFLILCLFLLLPMVVRGAMNLDDQTKRAVVLIAKYDDDDDFLGWGSGFFVDEGIVVTNKHVIEGADWYRVFATTSDYKVDFDCEKSITKSDMKINLDDDVAYVRVYLPCEHGKVLFADEDPQQDDHLWVMGYPRRGTGSTSFNLYFATGSVIGRTDDGWLATDALINPGNSGGPVVNDTGVIGVAVGYGTDENGNQLEGYFIPSSVIVSGLLYANDSRFGYTPQSRGSSKSSIRSSVSSSSSTIVSRSSSSRSSVSRSSIQSSRAPQVNSFEARTCERVLRWFRNNNKMMDRVNARLQKRFGFQCRA